MTKGLGKYTPTERHWLIIYVEEAKDLFPSEKEMPRMNMEM